MELKKSLIVISYLLIVGCNGQEKDQNKNNTIMREKVDLNLLEANAKKTATSSSSFVYEYEAKKENDDLVKISGSKEEGFVERIIKSKPLYQTIYKEYYPDGYIKKKEVYFGERTKIDVSEYYDEKGHLKAVDENKKFGKIKPYDILKFLEQKGIIDLSNGKGRFDENGNPSFEVQFEEKSIEYLITVINGKPNNGAWSDIGEPPAFLPIVYKMDGETGEIEELK